MATPYFKTAEILACLACIRCLNKNTARRANANPLVREFGINIPIPLMAQKILSHILRFLRKYLSKATPIVIAPNATKKKLEIISNEEPTIRIPGLNTNAQGTRKAAKPRRTARKPVFHGSPPEIPAAIYAPTHTGGVINERQPK